MDPDEKKDAKAEEANPKSEETKKKAEDDKYDPYLDPVPGPSNWRIDRPPSSPPERIFHDSEDETDEMLARYLSVTPVTVPIEYEVPPTDASNEQTEQTDVTSDGTETTAKESYTQLEFYKAFMFQFKKEYVDVYENEHADHIFIKLEDLRESVVAFGYGLDCVVLDPECSTQTTVLEDSVASVTNEQTTTSTIGLTSGKDGVIMAVAS